MLEQPKWKKDMETEIIREWENLSFYKFDPKSEKPVFSIDTPPPYVNTPVHIGHAATFSIMDMIARFRRMIGFNVLFSLCFDRNGLPIEMATEKRFGVSLSQTSREKFLEMCKQVLEENSLESIDSFKRLGISFNSWSLGTEIGSTYYTDSPEYRALTQATFIDLWNKGLIYEAERITNWCPGCQTTLADAEIEYVEKPTLFNEIVFKVKETDEKIVIATTRPELICTCSMIIFHPKDERWKHLDGKTGITPIYEKEVPIKAHPIADPKKGTGLVMMCSAGDLSDVRFFREMSLKPIIAINRDGTMNEHAGFLNGLNIKDARAKMIEELKKHDLLVGQKEMIHRTPVCERSKHEIEFISMSELYLKQMEFKDEIKKIANKINFYAPESKQILLDWINSISMDWPISRRRYYATEVPLWYCKKCGEPIVPEKGKYYQPWKEPAPVEKCPHCGCDEFRGEERVLDTWFDSSISPLYILGYRRDKEFFEKAVPCTLRPQGKEIVRTWLYYTLLRGYLLIGKPMFKDVWIHYHIIDGKGRKMSKSLGNIIDPHEILKMFGAEPFRLWCVTEGNLTKTDLRCSFERIEGASKTLNKLWNIARFISQFEVVDSPSRLVPTDRWIIKELNMLLEYSRRGFEKYDFHTPMKKAKHFLWETFASHYIELVKNRAYNTQKLFSAEEQKSALFTLHYCLKTLLKIVHPIIPFITYIILKDLYDELPLSFPQPFPVEDIQIKKEEIEGLNKTIWKAKKDNKLSLREPVSKLIIPEKFKIFEKDLKVMHNVKEIEYGNEINVIL